MARTASAAKVTGHRFPVSGRPVTIYGQPAVFKVTTITIKRPIPSTESLSSALDAVILANRQKIQDFGAKVAAQLAKTPNAGQSEESGGDVMSGVQTNWTPPDGATMPGDGAWAGPSQYYQGPSSDSAMNDVLNQIGTKIIGATGFNADLQAIWQNILQGIAKGEAAAAAVYAAALVLDEIGITVIMQILTALVNAILQAIAQALAIAGVSAISAGATVGASFGAVGAVIGAVIGASIAIGELAYGGQHLQIETGQTFACKDYVGTNITSAQTWLQNNPDKVVGLTVKRFAKQASLFMANPTWTYNNQGMMGQSFPPPPDPNSGDALDQCYQLLPGAYELINRVHFMAASALVNSDPTHLADYASIYKPLPGQAFIASDRWPNGYGQPAKAGPGYTNLYGSPSPGAGVYPDPIFSHGWKAITPMMNADPNHNDPESAPFPTRVGWGIGNVSEDGNSFEYTACPNMWTNDNTYEGTWPDGQGKINGQTDICPGIYNLQVMYPSLTTAQCELIFSKVSQAFDVAPSILPAGADGNLTDPDPQPVVPTAVFPPGTTMTGGSPDMTALQASMQDAQARYAALLATMPIKPIQYPAVATLTPVPVMPIPPAPGLSPVTSLGMGLLAGGGGGAVLGLAALPVAGLAAGGAALTWLLFGQKHKQVVLQKKIAALPNAVPASK